MTRNKEMLILLIDVGPSMHCVLSEVETVCSLLLQKKLIFARNDEVSVALFGTDETKNDLQTEVGGYEHVMVVHDMRVIDGDMAEATKSIPRGSSPSDFIDAIVVGLDIFVKRLGEKSKEKKRICLITNAYCPVKEPAEGSKEDQVDTLSELMNNHAISMDCIIFREPGTRHCPVMEENDRILKRFSSKSATKIVNVDNPTSLLGALKTRNVSPVTIFRGDLELGLTMKIKVWVYKKTSEEKFPTLKKYSDNAPSSDKFATREVKVDYEYKSIVEPEKIVPPEQRIKGYRYGPQVVPISSAEWDAVKFKPEKGVKVLGFTDSFNIKRHHYMKDVSLFIPEPGNTKAMVAVSALARAMNEMNKVAILRCVWKHGQGNVVIGVLTPNISSVDSTPDTFFFNVLPFAEDVREFHFRSFNNLPSSWKPTEEQQEAADNLVKMLDLAPEGRQEILLPELTPNPVLERYYRFLDLKSKQPDAGVPPLDNSLKRIVEPDPALISYQSPLLKNLLTTFELKENPKRKKKRTWSKNYSLPSSSQTLLKNSSETEELKIGDETPVQDFENMLARRDSSECVEKAFEAMKKYVNSILENSVAGSAFQKALDCLVALRKGCIIEQEPKEFNRYLTGLYEQFRSTDVAGFFDLLSSKNVSLICKEEAEDSDIPETVTKNFFAKAELQSQ